MYQIFRFCKFDPILLSRHYGNQGKNPTHYEVLRVPETASQKDIKAAFIKLSKEMHPDITGNKSHSEFVKVNEAYKVLSKELLRRDYDMNLKYGHSSDTFSHSPYSYEYKTESKGFQYYNRPNFRSREEYEQYMDYQMHNDYYSVKNIKRIRNFWVVFICVTITTIAAFIQVLLINKRVLESRNYFSERTSRYAKEYNRVKESLQFKTREEQIQDFITKVESAKSDNLETDPSNK